MKTTLKATVGAAALLITVGTLAGWNRAETTAETSVATAETAAAKTYRVDPVHTTVLFKIRHGGLSNFYGRFNAISGGIEFDKKDLANGSMSFTVDTGSIDTNSKTRDGHVKGADFFNSRQYDEATFTSTSIAAKGDGRYEVRGEFSFHGETAPVTVELFDFSTGQQQGKDALGFEAHFSFKRSEFGITKYVDSSNPEAGPLGDTVQVIVSLEAVAG